MALIVPLVLGGLAVTILMKSPGVRYLSSEMAATIGLVVFVFFFQLYHVLGLECLEQLFGLK